MTNDYCMNIFTSTEFWSAIIGGMFVLLGTYLEKINENSKERKKIKHTLAAINSEANFLKESFAPTIDRIKHNPDNYRFSYFTKNSQNYFTLYENNSSIIGIISNQEYKSTMINYFILCKNFYERLQDNSWLLEKKLEYQLLYETTNQSSFLTIANIFEKIMKDEAVNLKSLVSKLENQIKDYNEQHNKYIDQIR